MSSEYIQFNELPLSAERVPAGFVPVEAYAKGNDIVVPIANIPEGMEHLHDCDWEGCGSLDHVVRFSVKDKYSASDKILKLTFDNNELKRQLSEMKKKESLRLGVDSCYKGRTTFSYNECQSCEFYNDCELPEEGEHDAP